MLFDNIHLAEDQATGKKVSIQNLTVDAGTAFPTTVFDGVARAPDQGELFYLTVDIVGSYLKGLYIYSGTKWELVASDILDIGNKVQAEHFPALTGDITNTAGSIATTLKIVGTPGTYTKVTTDSAGRVSSGTNLGMTDVTSALGYTPIDIAGGTYSTMTSGYLTLANSPTSSMHAATKAYVDAEFKKLFGILFAIL